MSENKTSIDSEQSYTQQQTILQKNQRKILSAKILCGVQETVFWGREEKENFLAYLIPLFLATCPCCQFALMALSNDFPFVSAGQKEYFSRLTALNEYLFYLEAVRKTNVNKLCRKYVWNIFYIFFFSFLSCLGLTYF